jgi:hypothetical protein
MTSSNRYFNLPGLLFFILLLTGCNIIAYYQQDPFYRDGSGFDHVRFPLIKPYYAISITDDAGWAIPLEGKKPLRNEFYFQISQVESISVENDAIMVYSPFTQVIGSNIPIKKYYWFVLIPELDTEIGFETETDFLEYIHKRNIQEPNWREPLSILQEYDQTWCLPWISACQ